MSISPITIKASAHTERRKPPTPGTRILILGNGMVGQKLCEYLIAEKLNTTCQITVIGAEKTPAYDRINLTTLVDHRDPSRLTIRPANWYEENGIELHTGISATSIERGMKTVSTSSGDIYHYGILVIATGSSAFIPPPFDGAALPNLFVYRDLQDIEQIIASSAGKSSAVIIGGGLLGLEAAQAVTDLGLNATVMERSDLLMPQQLNAAASSILHKSVQAKGITVEHNKATTAISQKGSQLQLSFKDGSAATADLVILATGITPNTDFAKTSGLNLGVRGGIIVDDFLTSSDQDIFAVGEAALLHGRIFGLAAPGYAMALHLAKMLAGKKVDRLPPPDLSCRLKMAGADMVSIGSPLQQGKVLEFSSGSSYRMICTDNHGTIQGGLGIGQWLDSGVVQDLYLSGTKLSKKQISSFRETGELSAEAALSIEQWPDSRIVCNCMSIRKGELMSCMTECGKSVSALAQKTGASTVCGSCLPLLHQLCDPTAAPPKPVAYRSLISVSAIAFLATLLAIFIAPPAMAKSVESWWYAVDILWRDNFIKQISGYSLLGTCLIGLLLSLRKRFKWFRFGHFAKWRVFHSAFGVTALIILFAHTGFRFGDNLNFWLMLTFVALNLLGAIAGIVSAIESKGSTSIALKARRIRPILTYAHLVFFWPLPALLVFHILSVYLY
ncbi:FAD-dependent oxidoreductase [Luteolibacter sp. AS25]|uniref:FAD-dependent oxidoreductase n=2 Tax=Bacteria TaxID=2 RepID=UPI00398B0F4A